MKVDTMFEDQTYNDKQRKIISQLFMLLGVFSILNTVSYYIRLIVGNKPEELNVYEFYIVGAILLAFWIGLSFLLKKRERIAAILKVIYIVMTLVVGAEDLMKLWIIIWLFNIPIFIIFATSKSLPPYRVPAILFLIGASLVFIVPVAGAITQYDFIIHLHHIDKILSLIAGIITIINFKTWGYDEEGTL